MLFSCRHLKSFEEVYSLVPNISTQPMFSKGIVMKNNHFENIVQHSALNPDLAVLVPAAKTVASTLWKLSAKHFAL